MQKILISNTDPISSNSRDISCIDVDRPLGPPAKPSGYEIFRAMNSPKLVLAPMVDMSELPWRNLSRQYGAQLCYTPMIHAQQMAQAMKSSTNAAYYRTEYFDGRSTNSDRPLIAQFCGNDPDTMVDAAKILERINKGHLDAIDLNLGCPQGIAKRGNYGAFLMDDWKCVGDIISTLDRNISFPITAKIRVFESTEKTVQYAKMIEESGAKVLCVHGRTRDMKGTKTGLADWEKIKAVKQALSIPIIANGNILYYKDIEECLQTTGVDAVMIAETNLHNPAILYPSICDKRNESIIDFSSLMSPIPVELATRYQSFEKYPLLMEHRPAYLMAFDYLKHCIDCYYGFEKVDFSRDIMEAKFECFGMGSIRSHLFKMMRRILTRFPDFRARLDKSNTYAKIFSVLDELKQCVEQDILENLDNGDEAEWSLLTDSGKKILEATEELVPVSGGYRVLPYWVTQPYIRPVQSDNPDQPLKKDIVQAKGNISEHRRREFALREERKRRKMELRRILDAKPKNRAKYERCLTCENIGSRKCSHKRCQSCCKSIFHRKLSEFNIPIDISNVEEKVPNSTLLNLKPLYCPYHSTKKWKSVLYPMKNEIIEQL